MARFVATVTDRQLRSWKMGGLSEERMAELCGLTTSQISRRIQELWREAFLSSPEWDDPDEQTIRERCDEIQQGWLPGVRERRYVGPAQAWTPAVVPASVRALARR